MFMNACEGKHVDIIDGRQEFWCTNHGKVNI